ncbi:MAG: class I SAM-dependent methyltransferase, partial [Gammaproteobacteria bacterium]|nr:class I SAM-dependent methyltransferase [Gammaproteobacteria bacterium]
MNALDESVKRAASSERPAGPPPKMPEDLADRAARAGAGARSVEGRLLARLLEYLGNPPLEFTLWTGERIASAVAPPVAGVRVASRATLLGMLADVQMRFPDAYSEGRLDIEGDLVRVLEEVYHAGRGSPQPSSVRRLVERLRRPHVNSLSGSRENIHHHYDIGNEFYSLWLGETMAYT